jgi:hypothetical protein
LRWIGNGFAVGPSRGSNAPPKVVERGFGYVDGKGRIERSSAASPVAANAATTAASGRDVAIVYASLGEASTSRLTVSAASDPGWKPHQVGDEKSAVSLVSLGARTNSSILNGECRFSSVMAIPF